MNESNNKYMNNMKMTINKLIKKDVFMDDKSINNNVIKFSMYSSWIFYLLYHSFKTFLLNR